jgi:DnaJ-class molecular chaperone
MIPNEGMPVHGRSNERGNLYIEFDITFPPQHWAPKEKLALLEQVAPLRPVLLAVADEEVVDYAWLTKQELSSYLSADYYAAVKDSLADS